MIQVSVILDSFKVRMGFILFTPGVQRVWKITLSVNSWTEGEGKMNWFVGKLKKYNRRKYFWTYERIFSFKYQRWNFESLYSGHDLLAWTLNSEIKFFAEQFWMFFSFPSAVLEKYHWYSHIFVSDHCGIKITWYAWKFFQGWDE